MAGWYDREAATIQTCHTVISTKKRWRTLISFYGETRRGTQPQRRGKGGRRQHRLVGAMERARQGECRRNK